MIRLVRKDFRRWLLKNKRILVGEPDDVKKCPFCKYLKSKGATTVTTRVHHRIVDGSIHGHSKWQREFQTHAMKLQKDLDVIGLRGREALQVLDVLNDA